jgi:hypothetical protein
MRLQTKVSSWILTISLSTCALFAAEAEPFSVVPAEQREALAKRLPGYVEAYKGRKWEKLYGFVSDTGKGGATLKVFTAAMKSNHGRDFAQMPDLQELKPERTEKNENGFDIYGCGKAQRESMSFNGIVVVHAVFEHETGFSPDGDSRIFQTNHANRYRTPNGNLIIV